MTIATNMAGRGTDIMLGGNPAGLASEALHRAGPQPGRGGQGDTYDAALAEAKAETEEDHDRVVEAGGLHIIGTERHDSRRIDNQLRGRAGRQGDPGSSRFYLSLDDDLMKRFASDRVTGLMERLGLDEDVAIESRLVSRTIESAQSRVEGFNFDIRKRVVEFDDVINKQRETIYAERDKVLHNEDLTETVRRFLDEEIDVARRRAPRRRGPRGVGPRRASPHRCRRMGLDRRGDRGRHALGPGRARGHRRAPARARRRAGSTPARPRSARRTGRQVERIVLLRTIDSLWVEHLTELDDMRRGIGLRGYAQQDPLNEFRREAFRLYEEFRGLHPPRRRDVDLPGHGPAPAAARRGRRRRPGLGQGARRRCAAAPGTARVPARARSRRSRVGRRRPRSRARRSCAASLPKAPAVRNVTASLGGEPITDGAATRSSAAGVAGGGGRSRRCPARLHPDRRADRPQRPVLVRFGRQVQEVPRPLSDRIAADRSSRRPHRDRGASSRSAGYAAYRIWDQAGRDERRAADAIVVMGAAQYDGRPSPLFAARLDHAIDLYHDGVAPRLIVTGGKREGDRTTEAASAREYMLRHDVPEDAILAEDTSRTTLQSIRGVEALMTGSGLRTAVFVSDPTHMLRVLRMAADVGIDAYGSPTRTSPLERDPAGRVDAIVHELGALGVYFVTGESP